jgi:hypothetical protein
MIVLDTTSKLLRLVTSAAVAVDVSVNGVAANSVADTFEGFNVPTAIITATTTTISPAPGTNEKDEIKHVTICARGGACVVRPELFDGAVAYSLLGNATGVSLSQGETLEYTDTSGWNVVDVNCAIKYAVGPTLNGHVIKDNGTARTQRTNANTVSTATIAFTAVDDAGGDETELSPQLQGAGTDNSDGATITLGNGNSFLLITSTTAITAFAFTSSFTGRKATIRFNTARTLTHNGTSLILPTAANITTVAGDMCEVENIGGANFRVNWYQRADGQPIGLLGASQAEQETGTATNRAVTPGVQANHPSAAKCWGFTTGGATPALNAQSFNMTSITDTATGRLTVTIGTDFSSTAWVGVACCGQATSATTIRPMALVSKAAGTVIIECCSVGTTPAFADPNIGWDWVFFGDR